MLTASSLLSLLVIAVMLAEVISTPRFPNIGYLGSTYNIFKGNPQSTKGLDPGFTLRNMYHFTYDSGKLTADRRYLVPDNVDAVAANACKFDFDSEISQSTSSYRSSLEVNMGADFKGEQASFSASADYKEVHEGSQSMETKYVSSHAECEVYETSLTNTNTDSLFNPDFVTAVKLLSPNAVNQTYIDFYNHWGTHAVIGLTMGGRYGVRSSIATEDYISMSSKGIDIKTSAEYSGTISLNVNAATDDEKEQANQFESHRRDFQMYQIGGKPPLDSTGNVYKWQQSVIENPLPLYYQLLPITDVMTSKVFPDIPDIDATSESLSAALNDYCKSLDIPNPSLCDTDAADSANEDLITIHFTNNTESIYCNRNFQYPIPTSTDHYIIGGFYGGVGFDASLVSQTTIVVEDSPLLADSLYWEPIDIKNDWFFADFTLFKPICPGGFSGVSNFPSCGKDTSNFQRHKPCIANKCLTDCSWIHFADVSTMTFSRVSAIVYGAPQLGAPTNSNINPKSQSNLHLWNFITGTEFEDSGFVKCLTYKCLKIADTIS